VAFLACGRKQKETKQCRAHQRHQQDWLLCGHVHLLAQRNQGSLTRGEKLFETLATVVCLSSGLGMVMQFQEAVPEEQMSIVAHWLKNSAHLWL